MPTTIDLLDAFEPVMRALESAPSDEEAQGLLDREIERHAAANESADASITTWITFLREHAPRIARGRSTALLQFAHGHADDSPVTEAAERWLQRSSREQPWLRRTNRPEHLSTIASTPPDATRAVVWLGFDEKSDRLVAAERGGRVVVMETDYGETLRTVDTGLRGVYAAGLQPDGRTLYVLDEEHSVVAVNLQTRTHLYLLESRDTRMAAISPDGQYSALHMADGSLHVWDLYDTEHTVMLEGVDVAALRVLRGHRVLVVSSEGQVTLIDARSATMHPVAKLGRAVAKNEPVYSDGRVLCVMDENHDVRCMDLESGAVLRLERPHEGALSDAQFRADNPFFVTAGNDGALRAWDAHTGEPMARWDHDGPVTAAVLGAYGRIALGDAMGRVLLFR